MHGTTGPTDCHSWIGVDGPEEQLDQVLSKLSDPLIQAVGVLMNRINEHVECKARSGLYLGGNMIVQVINESGEVISRAAKVIEAVMEAVGDRIFVALDYKIEKESNANGPDFGKVPGCTPCKLQHNKSIPSVFTAAHIHICTQSHDDDSEAITHTTDITTSVVTAARLCIHASTRH